MIIPKWICEQCGKVFERRRQVRNGKRTTPRFCGNACCALWRKENGITIGCFKKGHVPWNKNIKGTHFSPATEFKKGCVSANKLPIGSTTIRTRKRDNLQRAWVKLAEPNVWEQRSRVNWEYHRGPIPRGYVVHRIDGVSLNDEIDNLELLSRAEHMDLHRHEFDEKARSIKSSRTRKIRAKERRESQYDTYYWQPEAVPSEAELAEIRRER